MQFLCKCNRLTLHYVTLYWQEKRNVSKFRRCYLSERLNGKTCAEPFVEPGSSGKCFDSDLVSMKICPQRVDLIHVLPTSNIYILGSLDRQNWPLPVRQTLAEYWELRGVCYGAALARTVPQVRRHQFNHNFWVKPP